MRKTFSELVTDICGKDKYDTQNYSSDDIEELLELVREQTIKECLDGVALILYGSPGLKQFEERFNKLSKDSIMYDKNVGL